VSRVLVVDDDAIVRALAERSLAGAGFEVTTLADGRGVVEAFVAQRPDAVLLDVMLPGLDGYSICRALQALPDAAYVPIAMLTALNDEEAIRLAFEAGATEFLPKPINWVYVIYRLRYLLRSAATMRDLDTARRTIARAKREWERTFDAIEDPVMLISADLIIQRANMAAARMGSLPIRDMIGKPCRDVFCRGRPCVAECPVSRALAAGKPVRAEVREYGSGRSDCLVSAAPVLNGGSAPDSVVYFVKDVTEYRQLERELLQLQKMEALGVLAAGVAHDFNNLLQGVAGWADILAAPQPSPAQLAEGLTRISGVVMRGRALTQQLLFTSRKAEGRKRPTAVGAIAMEVTALLGRTIPKSVKIEEIVPDDLWCVNAEGTHLHQAFMNLAVNASQAMPDGGVLRLEAVNVVMDEAYCRHHPDAHAGPHVMIAIADTGIGIAPAVLPHIYEPFFTTKAPGTGTGLGLSVTYGIVRDHGGHICCYTEVGHGTTFRVYLPALPVSRVDDALQAPQPAPASGRGMTVLVADDEPVILEVVSMLLERSGYRVVRTSDGRDALDYFLAHRDQIDAVLLDINMPRMDGEQCLKALRESGCSAPVLLSTGALLTAERQARILEVADGVLMKPFESSELLRKIAGAIDTARRDKLE
jgi:CheY-like chemotaxis protein